MKLDKITLTGFKSFPDRTVLKFKPGMVAMVGPNGCGKSNIVDAFRWVMGESRASQLRQETNADIIFSGAEGRRASSLCSVELSLQNDGSKDLGMWNQYAELSVRREIERDGESAYFINGQKVRRKDVVDVFAGTGSGARAYGIVEQERVTQVVRADPKRVREHLEEAAGVSLYKERRKETESRIGVSQANLARIDDTIAELRRQMGSLAHQAKQTERVRKQKQRLAAARLLSLQMRHEALLENHGTAREDADKAKGVAEKIKDKCLEAEKELEKARKGRQDRAESLNKSQGRHFEAIADQEKARQALKDFEAAEASDKAMLDEADASVKELTEKSDELGSIAKSLEDEIGAGKKDIDSAKKELAGTKGKLDGATAEAKELGEKLEKSRLKVAELHRTENEVASSMRLAKHRVESLDDAIANAKGDLEGLAPAEKPDNEALEALRADLAKAVDKAVANERSRQELGEDIVAAKEESARLQGAKGGLVAERDLLQRISGQQTEKYESWLARSGVEGARRVIEELDIVAPGNEGALDAVLSTHLQGYVVSDIKSLLKDGGLPAGMVLLDRAHDSKAETHFRKISGVRPLIECIRFSDAWQKVLSVWLDGVYLAQDLQAALGASDGLRHGETLVTPEGVCFRDGVVCVASDKKAGIKWWSQLAEVEKKLAKIDGQIEAHAKKLGDMVARHEKLAAAGQELAESRRKAEEKFDELSQKNIRLGHAFEYREEQARRSKAVIDGAVKEREKKQESLQKETAALEEASEGSRREAKVMEGLEKDHADKNDEVARLRELHGVQEASVHRLELTMSHNKQRLDEAKARKVEIKVSLSNARVKIVEIQARQRKRDPSKHQQELDRTSEKVKEAQKELDKANEGSEDLEKLEVSLQEKLAAARAELENTQGRQRELEIDVATRQVEADGIKAQLDAQKDGAEDAQALRKEYPGQEQVQGLVERLEGRIERAGPINYAAEAELAACEERLEEVNGQREDLSEALEALQQAIRRIDDEMLERLKNVHEKLRTGFDAMFKKLFDGGHASVELVGDSLLSAGLQLSASPPGKKSASIQALSGGEKTLTAIAFLFALNELNPPIFCILDEVDAALDEANTVRLCRLVEGMADRMQFLVITHNKQVIERADWLVGVTQHDKGVSNLVAVQVDQALEQAKLAVAGGGQ